jgi:hypothetical protein
MWLTQNELLQKKKEHHQDFLNDNNDDELIICTSQSLPITTLSITTTKG